MSNADRKHFDTYPEQTRIKHDILREYWKRYLQIIAPRHGKVIFLDGFAGRGQYEDQASGEAVPGSPLIAMEIAASVASAKAAVDFLLIEKWPDHFAILKEAAPSEAKRLGLKAPHLHQGEFSDFVSRELHEFDKKPGAKIAPLFAFVDPCGVAGANLKVIVDILRRPFCEVFIFFNMDGVRRIAGLLQDGKEAGTLREFFGSDIVVEHLRAEYPKLEPEAREDLILGTYREELRVRARADFLSAFRVESQLKATTSHYLIHATKHPLGYRIMKHIMWEAGKRDGDAEGGMELLQRSSYRLRFRPDLQALDAHILEHLRNGPKPVAFFLDSCVNRPDDYFPESCYRRRILAMEQEGRVEVVRSNGMLASNRVRRKGELTLSKKASADLHVRLPVH